MTARATIMIISGFRASTCSSRRRLSSLSPHYCISPNSLQRRLHTPYPSQSPLHRHREMAEMTTRRRIHGNGDSANGDKAKSPKGAAVANGEREHHDHGPSNSQPHKHSHSHGMFGGHSHSHGHGHDGHDHGGGLIETLQSGGAHPCRGPIHTVYFTTAHTFFSFVLSSRSLVSSRIVKVTEEVASHLLDWSRMFS